MIHVCALDRPAGSRFLKIAELLMEAGANPHLGDKVGHTPLDHAKGLKDDEMAIHLVKAMTLFDA